jgi:NAD(P)-dependent dehydrogenase (short-subunit alcohol dehydrogenase family)
MAITGGASGIGYATASLFASQDTKAAVMDVNKAQLDTSAPNSRKQMTLPSPPS